MAQRIRCDEGEWKPRSAFSQRQLSKYDQNARSGRARPDRTGIRCQDHSNSQTRQMECEGPCGRLRDLRLFSKSTRRSGTNWCVDCVDWQIRQEPDDFLPAPGEEASPGDFLPATQFSGVQVGDSIPDLGAGNTENAENHGQGTSNTETPVGNSGNANTQAAITGDAQSSSANQATPVVTVAPSPVQQQPEEPQAASHAVARDIASYGAHLVFLTSPQFLKRAHAKPPVWLIPDLSKPWSLPKSELNKDLDEDWDEDLDEDLDEGWAQVSTKKNGRNKKKKTGWNKKNSWAKAKCTRTIPSRLPDYCKAAGVMFPLGDRFY